MPPNDPSVESGLSFLVNSLLDNVPGLTARQRNALREEIEREAKEIATTVGSSRGEPPSGMAITIVAFLLSSYRVLVPDILNREAAIEVLRTSLTARLQRNIASYIADRFDIRSDQPGDAFAKIARNFKTRGEERFGRAFVYEQEVREPERSFINVRRCFFNDYFREQGTPELTPILCELDNIWAEELQKPQYRLRFQRPSTLATGGEMCRFQFFNKRD